jgi:hypothetical protein
MKRLYTTFFAKLKLKFRANFVAPPYLGFDIQDGHPALGVDIPDGLQLCPVHRVLVGPCAHMPVKSTLGDFNAGNESRRCMILNRNHIGK